MEIISILMKMENTETIMLKMKDYQYIMIIHQFFFVECNNMILNLRHENG